jgi:phenylalanyl-tRNA synthetase beta chain
MRFSERWLREWVNPPISTERLVEQLTLAGLEVDSVTPVAPRFSGVVVAKVLEVRPATNHLKRCRVDAGRGAPVTVVCGAANVREGLCVALAHVGARLPDRPAPIQCSMVRGVASEGMLLSSAELGLTDAAEALLELPQDAPLGHDLWALLALDDAAIEVDLTPNRGDCLSVAGIAREVGVLNQYPVTGPVIRPVAATIEDTFAVEIGAPAACPHYAGRVIRGIDPSAPTPLWMQERLRRSGVRSISAVVDITNYVMLELGQPMHAFDLEQLRGGIRVRWASEGETLTLLDGQALRVEANTLVIADQARAIALAGIMGGLGTAVTKHTREVFLESAFFSPEAMAGQARRYHLQTESSHRFERGVDFELQARALERATELLTTICGGQPGPVIEHRSAEQLPQRVPILLRASRITRVLGMQIADATVSGQLEQLGMRVESDKTAWRVTPPSFRFDVTIEADLIEELARIAGYDRIPSHLPQRRLKSQHQPETRLSLSRIRQRLVDRGYHEVITYSFVDGAIQARIEPYQAGLMLANPISSELGVMRTSLWPGLIQALHYNQNRQCERIRLFEIGLVFIPREGGDLYQQNRIGGIVAGPAYPQQWGIPSRPVDFFDLKGDVEAMLALTGPSTAYQFEPVEHPALHPGQAAQIQAHGRTLGLMGALHPALIRELSVEGPVFLFQMELEGISQGELPAFRPLSKFPWVRRDISIVLDRDIPASEVIQCLRKDLPEAVKDLQLFDLYEGEGIDFGKKSLALGLIFQGTSSTLIERDIETIVEHLTMRLSHELGAQLRS